MASQRGQRRGHARLLSTVFLALAILVLPAAIYAWGRNSSAFAIEKIAVGGSSLVPKDRLERLLRRDYLKRNLFTVTNEDVGKTLETVPYVASVSVDRDFPTTLRVEVHEHVPIAYVLAANGWFVVADSGHVVAKVAGAGEVNGTLAASAQEPSGDSESETDAGENALPLADAVSDDDSSPSPSPSVASSEEKSADAGSAGVADDGQQETDPDLVAALQAGPVDASLKLPRFAVAADLTPGGALEDASGRLMTGVAVGLSSALRDRLDVLVVEDGQVRLLFSDGLEVVWGSGERARAKLLALKAVLKRYSDAGTSCVFMDVSMPDRVLARPVLP